MASCAGRGGGAVVPLLQGSPTIFLVPVPCCFHTPWAVAGHRERWGLVTFPPFTPTEERQGCTIFAPAAAIAPANTKRVIKGPPGARPAASPPAGPAQCEGGPAPTPAARLRSPCKWARHTRPAPLRGLCCPAAADARALPVPRRSTRRRQTRYAAAPPAALPDRRCSGPRPTLHGKCTEWCRGSQATRAVGAPCVWGTWRATAAGRACPRWPNTPASPPCPAGCTPSSLCSSPSWGDWVCRCF
mmetsp:Transcript_14215/g.36327  ORF Transcript_14215/g.36327 Transcript_14215/m.36327 type:complete len:244 (+) Transcript_14215:165-896(+)